MRLWHLSLAVIVIAVVMSIARDPAGRVALIVFATGLYEVVLGTTALLTLFQAVGAIGEAKGLQAHVEALAATTVVLVASSLIMLAGFFAGAWLVRAVTAY